MPSLFYLPKVVSLPGAKLYFYQTGTSTPQNVYTDVGLTVAHASPVVANASGVFAPIYLDPRLPSYRVTRTTSADVLIDTVDDVPSNQNKSTGLRIESTTPELWMYDTDGTVNSRKIRLRINGADFEIAQSNDAENSFTNLFSTANVSSFAQSYSGSFTGTLTGFTAATTGTVLYQVTGRLVYMSVIAAISGTSNTTAMTMTGIPAAAQPSHARSCKCTVQDTGNSQLSAVADIFGSSITFRIAKSNAVANYVQYLDTGFTNSGAKGIPASWNILYYLD